MPVYTYRREDGTTFDIRQKFGDRPLNSCPTTGQVVNRVIQPAGIIFKGSGFYVNDNNKAKNPAGKKENGKSADTAAQKPEAKPDGKNETKSEKRASAPAAK